MAEPARRGPGETGVGAGSGLRIAEGAGLSVEGAAPGWRLVVLALGAWPAWLARGTFLAARVAAGLVVLALLIFGLLAQRFAGALACATCDQEQVRLVGRAFA